MINIKNILVAATLILSGCNESTSTSNETMKSSASGAAKIVESVIECVGKKSATNQLMDVIGNDHLLYTLPNDKSPAIVNKKASEIFGTTEYHQIDSSTRVRVHCDEGEWAYVQLTEPEWLTDVKGWAKLEYLKPMHAVSGAPTKALDSALSLDNVAKISTSDGLSKADLAWHAINTYGLNCPEVISKGDMAEGGYYLITCSTGLQLQVYPRKGNHPNIIENKINSQSASKDTPYGSCPERAETYQKKYEGSGQSRDLVCYQKALDREMSGEQKFDCPYSAQHYQTEHEISGNSSDLVCFQQTLERELR